MAVSLRAGGDGGFESPLVPQRTYVTYHAGERFGPWRVTRGSVDLSTADWLAASGRQSVDLSGDSAGEAAQGVPTRPGRRYRLAFRYAGNPGGEPPVEHLGVLLDGLCVADLEFDTTGRTVYAMGWRTFTMDFQAAAPSTRVAFRSGDDTDVGPVIDDVSGARVTPARHRRSSPG